VLAALVLAALLGGGRWATAGTLAAGGRSLAVGRSGRLGVAGHPLTRGGGSVVVKLNPSTVTAGRGGRGGRGHRSRAAAGGLSGRGSACGYGLEIPPLEGV
jgi:hypothetical protein